MNIEMIEREAKLLEAGSYPDRGVEITEEDLDLIAANTADAPVRIEHTDTPFDGALGVLKSVYRKGRELFGKLCFTAAAWELIKAANARRLSVALRKDKSSIAEVSLVREPRVADAAVFGGCETVRFDGCGIPDERQSADVWENAPGSGDKEADTRFGVDSAIAEFKRAGKLAPAAEPFARAMLSAGDASLVRFGEGMMPASVVFRRFLESQPKVIEFAELAPSCEAEAGEPEIFAKLGVTSSQVEKHRRRQAAVSRHRTVPYTAT